MIDLPKRDSPKVLSDELKLKDKNINIKSSEKKLVQEDKKDN